MHMSEKKADRNEAFVAGAEVNDVKVSEIGEAVARLKDAD